MPRAIACVASHAGRGAPAEEEGARDARDEDEQPDEHREVVVARDPTAELGVRELLASEIHRADEAEELRS